MTVERTAVEEGLILRPGETLSAGYEVVQHLHRSRYLDVYDVWSDERSCTCAAKVVRPDRMQDQRARDALIREGHLLLSLTHPHIVRAYELIEQPDPVLVLETVVGDTLGYIIEEEQRLPLNDVVYLGLHLSSAMQYLHRRGFLHLDLKPDNIISCSGLAKVIDFSTARHPGPASTCPGTPIYMAPEQAAGGLLSAATDVWSIGSVLYEALAGRTPFEEPEEGEDDARPARFPQLEGRAPALRLHRRVPAAVASAIDRCLEPEPSHRPTLDDLGRTLKAAISS